MRGCVSVSVDPQNVYFADIAEKIATNCKEDEFLEELADANEHLAAQSKDAEEKAFALAAAARLYELAKWFKENAP